MAQRSREKPDRPALWHKDGEGEWVSLCWKEYWDQVRQLAGVMEQHGLQPGDKVAVILPTSVGMGIDRQGGAVPGLVVVGIEPHMARGRYGAGDRGDPPSCAVCGGSRNGGQAESGTKAFLSLREDVPEGQVRGLLHSSNWPCLERCC
ncbi:MAG: AMP-binding protein [Elusimicrobia bacterium]|nr:AMP-binding protein [Elusimicrobiota bacterium]